MLKFYKSEYGHGKHLIINNENDFYISHGSGFSPVDVYTLPVEVRTLVENKDPFEFEENNYLGNGIIRIQGTSSFIDLVNNKIVEYSEFKREITLRSGDIFQLYNASGDIIIMKKGTTIGCNIKKNGRYVTGLYDTWPISRNAINEFEEIDEVTIEIECIGNSLIIKGEYPGRDCTIDLINKEFIEDMKFEDMKSENIKLEFKPKKLC